MTIFKCDRCSDIHERAEMSSIFLDQNNIDLCFTCLDDLRRMLSFREPIRKSKSDIKEKEKENENITDTTNLIT